jgi:hypothetical protein
VTVITSPSHVRRYTHVVVLALLALLAAVALTAPGTASAATPCGKKVLADWFDNGRIDRLYPLHCYEEAIDAIPRDLRDYADAEEVISRALQAAVNGKLAPGGDDPTPGGDDPIGGPGTSGPGDPNDPLPPTGGGSSGPQAAPEVDETGLSSLPVPLLVLGGMSLALLAAGGLGYLSRRRAAAEIGPDGSPPGDDLP